jgi:L-proline amide hydrolase
VTHTDVVTSIEGTMSWENHHTWYRVVGDLARAEASTPLVICHGGPGLTHDYMTSVAALAQTGRPCVLYDQIGNGRSAAPPDAPASLWTVDLFVRELTALVEHLGIAGGYHVLGHSWGGMLALELALRHPLGLRSITVADAFASSAVYMAEVGQLIDALPAAVGAAVREHEAAGTTDAKAYRRAMRTYYRSHVYRGDLLPDDLARTMTALEQDSTVYNAMNGPSEFSLTGCLRDWDVTDRLDAIDVPVLLLSGRYDQVTPATVAPLQRGLTDVRWTVFEDSSHMPHLEEPERFVAVVREFLDEQAD